MRSTQRFSTTRNDMIDLTTHPETLEAAVGRARERSIRIPTFEQMRNPSLVPADVKSALGDVGLWDLDPLNLFRITWHNEPTPHGGGFGPVNFMEIPPELSGVDARIVVLEGKWFPTGAHKVGAAFGCLVPRLVTGQFDPTRTKAVWPSTGNYCRGGAYDSNLLGCESIAILPEGMSRERFEWLESVAGEIIKTPGSESNVKEIFDKCNELAASGEDLMIFNQFDEFGNYLWHWAVTGPAMEEVIETVSRPRDRFAGVVLTTGSAGTIGSGDYLKQRYPTSKIAAGEAIQCPTMLYNGFGEHRIEGIGDKHIPWVHNVRNSDFAIGLDDEATISLTRLFNEPAGREYLADQGVKPELVEHLDLLGISGIGNLLGAIKFAKYNELTSSDIVVTLGTDSMEMYGSRVEELRESRGEFTVVDAAATFHRHLLGAGIDHVHELSHYDRKRIHNLKYYTWVEQQGKTYDEIQAQWYDPDYWTSIQALVGPIDRLIEEFNAAVGV
jgi:cysteine synthase